MDLLKLLESGGVAGALIAVIVISYQNLNKIIAAFQVQMDERLKLWVEHLDKRDSEWREFLAEQRGVSVQVQEKLSAEIAANTKVIRELVESTQQHQIFTKDAFDSMRRRLDKPVRKAKP